MAKKKPKTFGYCTACRCREKIDGTCRVCGDTDKPPAKAKTPKKTK